MCHNTEYSHEVFGCLRFRLQLLQSCFALLAQSLNRFCLYGS